MTEEDAGQQHRGCEYTSWGYQDLVKLVQVKPRIQRVSVNLPTSPLKLRKRASVHIAKGLRRCQPKAKAKAQIKTQPSAQVAAPTQTPKGAWTPIKSPE